MSIIEKGTCSLIMLLSSPDTSHNKNRFPGEKWGTNLFPDLSAIGNEIDETDIGGVKVKGPLPWIMEKMQW